MKIVLLVLSVLTMHAHALDDDLFWKPGKQGPTARSFIWGGKTYQSVRIAHFDGSRVLITSAEGQASIPFSDIPSLWQSAVRQRNWPSSPPQELSGMLSPGQRPQTAARRSSALPAPAPKYTTIKEWEAARLVALERVKAKAAADWKDSFSMQQNRIEREMRAWEKLHPRPADPETQPETDTSPAQEAERPEDLFNYTWEKVYAADTETDDSVYAYNTRVEQNRNKALKMAQEIAIKTWPNSDNSTEREAKTAKLMQLWDEHNPFITKSSNLPDEGVTKDDVARIKRWAKEDWPNDYSMQLYVIKKQTTALNQLYEWCRHTPFEIARDDFFDLWRTARKKWPGDYDMQASEIKRQAEALAEIRKLESRK